MTVRIWYPSKFDFECRPENPKFRVPVSYKIYTEVSRIQFTKAGYVDLEFTDGTMVGGIAAGYITCEDSTYEGEEGGAS